ncbi:MAG: alpha-galactosidase [Ruminococcaceae bacterium]|nr:alpha-galactosidase [Oscillospiraceae bacterium]
MIQDNKTFLLRTQKTAYMLMVNDYGHIEHIHYGAPVSIADAKALRYKHNMQYGSQVMYDEADLDYCLDNVPLNWSGIGKGDFRITPLEMEMPDGTYTSDFLFEYAEILDGAIPAKTLPGAYCGDDSTVKSLILNLKERVFNIKLQLIYTVYPDENIITRRTVILNREEKPLILRRIMSFLLDIPNKNYKLTNFAGDWIKEANRHDQSLVQGCFVNQSTTGSSSNRQSPGIMLSEQKTSEDAGCVYGFNLIYSGNHYTAVELCPRGMVRIISGINPLCFSWTLNRDESFETPEAVLTFSAEGYNGMSRNFHNFVNRRIVRGPWKDKERPVLLNNWEAHFFDFARHKLLCLARRAKDIGVELFVLDDGWFGSRNSDKAGLGDYTINLKKLPGGISCLAEKVTKMGMRFGLWFEPESVNTDSDLYRSHPEYAIQIPGRKASYGRNQLLLDLTRPDVRDYIVKSVGSILDSAEISYVKWDMNRHMSDMFSETCKQGEFYHRYILGLYEILERIFKPRPHILLESCSSGGNRFDLGMLCYSPQIWASDNTDPIERLKIQKGLSYFYPPSTMGAHVSQSPHMQTLRKTALSTRFNVSAFGVLGYELDLGELTPIEKTQVKEQIAFYKKWRQVFQFGEFRRSDCDNNLEQFTCISPDKKRAAVCLAQTLATAAPSNDILSVKGLEKNIKYHLKTVAQKIEIARFGSLLKHVVPISLKANGLVLRTANKYYAMPDGEFSAEATGQALCSGIGLNNQFISTGYSSEIRMWGDFGSQLYTIEAEVAEETEAAEKQNK